VLQRSLWCSLPANCDSLATSITGRPACTSKATKSQITGCSSAQGLQQLSSYSRSTRSDSNWSEWAAIAPTLPRIPALEYGPSVRWREIGRLQGTQIHPYLNKVVGHSCSHFLFTPFLFIISGKTIRYSGFNILLGRRLTIARIPDCPNDLTN